MKKPLICCFILCLGHLSLSAVPTYYGLSGMAFLPGARIGEPSELSMALRSTPADSEHLTIHPLSFSACFPLMPFLEIGLTNTYQFYQQSDMTLLGLASPGSGFKADRSNIYAPIIPSIKLSFLDEAVPNGAIAIGFLYPLGAFFCFDYRIPLPSDFCLYFLFGFGTTIETLTPFLGVKAELPFGFDVLLEGAYSGMTDHLTSSQETFFAASVSYEVAKRTYLDFTFRLDQDLVRRAMFGYELKL